MRITTKVAAAGGRSITRIPFAARRLDECLGPDGRVDEAAARRAIAEVADSGAFMPSSDDDARVYSATLLFLDRLHDAYRDCIANPEADMATECQTRQDGFVARRMRQGKHVFVTNDITRVADGVRARLRVGNPYGIVGQSEAEAVQYAAVCAEVWMLVARQVAWLRVEASADILAQARAAIAAAEARRDQQRLHDQHAACDRRHGGFCSPPDFACPFYHNGTCTWS